MKINATVTAVEERQLTLSQAVLVVNLTAEMPAEWKRPMEYKLEVPSNSVSQRTYHVGREIVITVEPKP